MSMTSDEQNKIIEALGSQGARFPCWRCGNTTFTLVDEYASILLSRNPPNLTIAGTDIPCVVTACNGCGILAIHALLVIQPPSNQK